MLKSVATIKEREIQPRQTAQIFQGVLDVECAKACEVFLLQHLVGGLDGVGVQVDGMESTIRGCLRRMLGHPPGDVQRAPPIGELRKEFLIPHSSGLDNYKGRSLIQFVKE